VFEGTEEAVKQAVTWCRRGERPARVDDVTVVYSPASGEFGYFSVTF
jgi:acylphosphatase